MANEKRAKTLPPHAKGEGSRLLKVFEKAFHRGDRPEAVLSAMLDGYLMTLYDRYRSEVAHDEPFADLLGPLYMELSSRFKQSSMGQYFTPLPLASMMAAMTAPQQLEPGRIYRICDPACGSGVMMLAMLQHVLRTHVKQALRWFAVSGIDLDPLCTRMFAVQMSENILAHRIELAEVHVLQGNSLGDHAKLKTLLHMASAGMALHQQDRNAQGEGLLVQAERKGEEREGESSLA